MEKSWNCVFEFLWEPWVWLQIQGSWVWSLPSPILSWRFIMEWFLQSFSSFHWFKKGCHQLQAKVWAQSTDWQACDAMRLLRPNKKINVFRVTRLKILGRVGTHILGQKVTPHITHTSVYGGSFTNLSRTICHSLSADSWVMGPWGCPSYHCHRTESIEKFTPTVLSIMTSRHYTMISWTRMV